MELIARYGGQDPPADGDGVFEWLCGHPDEPTGGYRRSPLLAIASDRDAGYAFGMDNKQAKAAAEAREILNRSAEVLEAEWQRLMRAFESSEMVPAPVKQQLTQAVNRLNAIVDSTTPPSGRDVARELVEAAGEVRSFVTNLAGAMIRSAAEAGFPVPGAAPAPGATTPPPPPATPAPVVSDPAPAAEPAAPSRLSPSPRFRSRRRQPGRPRPRRLW